MFLIWKGAYLTLCLQLPEGKEIFLFFLLCAETGTFFIPSWHIQHIKHLDGCYPKGECNCYWWGAGDLSVVNKGCISFFYVLLKERLELIYLCPGEMIVKLQETTWNLYMQDLQLILCGKCLVSRKSWVQLWLLFCMSGAQDQLGARCWWRESRRLRQAVKSESRQQ